MSKINYFVAKREMSENVIEFMKSFVWKKEIQLRYASLIDTEQKSLENADKLRGSAHEKSKEEIMSIQARILGLQEEKDAELEKCQYQLSDADKELKKALKKAKDEIAVRTAVVNWLKQYFVNGEYTGTGLVDEIVSKFGMKLDMRTLVNSSKNECLVLDVNRALQALYGTLYTGMCNAGTIKPAQIPEIVRDKYVKKEKKAK